MTDQLKQVLSHVYWIGGGTDAGKSTVSRLLAERNGWQVYHYDNRDGLHHDCLAQTMPDVSAFLKAKQEERWITPTPEALRDRSLRSFRHRFPLALLDLVNIPEEQPVVAEGFGLTPDLVAPLLSRPEQAIFFAPTETFKWQSMKGRDKYTRRLAWQDGERAIANLFRRDMLITAAVRQQAQDHGLRVHEVDGSLNARETADLLARQFTFFES